MRSKQVIEGSAPCVKPPLTVKKSSRGKLHSVRGPNLSDTRANDLENLRVHYRRRFNKNCSDNARLKVVQVMRQKYSTRHEICREYVLMELYSPRFAPRDAGRQQTMHKQEKLSSPD